MTKKLMFGVMAGAMLFTSCQNEADLGTNVKEAMVSFKVSTPEIASRAFSDGTTATQLQYAVYDAAGNELTALTKTNEEIHVSKTVNLKLTTGNTYSVVFWAAAQDAPYTVNLTNKTMTVNYTGALSNDENRDAFYAYKTFTVNGTQTENVELKRPFAQLNIGTNDYAASANAGYTPTVSAVTVKNLKNTLDFVTGNVSGDDAAITFAEKTIPTTETFPVAGYEYLAMNYILVGAEKEVVDIEFKYSDGSNTKDRTVGSVPVQRNYRTNIYGQLLTSNVDVNVEIKPGFDDKYNKEIVEVATAQQLNDALANPEVGEVVLTEDITLDGSLTFGAPASRANITLAGRDFVIDGKGKTIKVVKASTGRVIDFTKETNGASLTLKNLTIENNISWVERVVNYNTNGTLTLDNVKILNADGCSNNYAINLPGSSDNAKVVIKDSEIWGGAIALNIWGESTLANITNSKLYIVDNNEVEGYAVVSLNNDGTNAAHNSNVNVEGGEIKVNYKGNGETTPSSSFRDATNGSKINISTSTEVVGEIKIPVASVVYEGYNEFYSFTTLQAAIDKVQKDNNGSVRLIKDLVVDKTITIANDDFQVVLDMNGYDLSYAIENDGKASAVFVVNPNANLKIVNNKSTEESVITFVAKDPDLSTIPGYATNTITNEGTLYIGAGVKVINESEGGASYSVDDKGKFTLDGGKLVANRCALRIAKYNQDDVMFTMNSGLVEAVKPAWIQLPGSDNKFAPKITVVINGGTIQSTSENPDEANILYTYSFGNSHANTNITITGGNFLKGTVSIGSGYKGDAPNLTINGGKFDYDVVQWLENDNYTVLYKANNNNQ